MALFNVLIDIAARTANMEQGVKRVEKQFDELGEYAKKAGELIGVAFTADYFKEMIESTIESGAAMANAAKKAGESVEQFSALAYAAKQTDVSMESLSASIKYMQRNIADNNPAIAQLGVSIDELKDKAPNQQLEVFADKIAGIEDPAQRTKYALALFGKAGTDIIPLLAEGSEGIKKFISEAERLGLTLDEKTAKSLEDADRRIKLLTSTVDSWKKSLVAAAEQAGEFLGFIPKSQTDIEKLQAQLQVLTRTRDSLVSEYNDRNNNAARFINAKGTSKDLDAIAAKMNANQAQIIQKTAELNKLQADSDKSQLHEATVLSSGSPDEPDYKIRAITAYGLNAGTNDVFKKNLEWSDAYIKSLDDAQALTQTDSEKILAQWQKFDDSLTLLVQQGAITQEEAAKRSAEYVDKVLPEVTLSVHKVAIESGKTYDEMSEYAKAAAQGIQSVMADFLFDPFKDGLKGMASGFLDVIRKMIAQAEAAKLAEYLFGGTKQADGSTTTGVLSSVLTSIAGSFASGGYANAGSTYLIGEKGPELFTPGASGTVTPNNALGSGGSANITQHLYIQSGVDTELRKSVPSIMSQAKDSAVATILDMKRRGKF